LNGLDTAPADARPRWRVLLVDDHPHVLRVLRLTLEKEGFEVATAANGEEGLFVAELRMPDAVVTDIQMPRMNGREFCAALDERFPLRAFPIFVMTSMTERSERAWSSAMHDVVFLEKPVSPRELAARLVARRAQATGGAA
jgi:CheY-like chemotaxis protein